MSMRGPGATADLFGKNAPVCGIPAAVAAMSPMGPAAIASIPAQPVSRTAPRAEALASIVLHVVECVISISNQVNLVIGIFERDTGSYG